MSRDLKTEGPDPVAVIAAMAIFQAAVGEDWGVNVSTSAKEGTATARADNMIGDTIQVEASSVEDAVGRLIRLVLGGGRAPELRLHQVRRPADF